MAGTPVEPPALPRARAVIRAATASGAAAAVHLDYEARFLRRKRLVTDAGWAVLVDLASATSLEDGDALVLDDGRQVAVHAAPEPVLVVRGELARLAWHIGNRHTPCQIGPEALVIREDHVLEAMLRRLGAEVAPAMRPFTPEGGAYGHGRTMGHRHDHGPDGAAVHEHEREGEHAHEHGHRHEHGHGRQHGHDHP